MSGFLCELLGIHLFIPANLHYFVFFFVFVFADRPRYQVRSACHLHTFLCSAKTILCTCLRIRKIFTVMATVQAQSLPAIHNERFSSSNRNEKRYIVFLIASAGWFSTLSSFIYYPVIPLVARDLRTTIANVNLTVTSYLAVSGVTPAFVGDAADILGRRPLYIITPSIYVLANMGIALQGSFVALLLLRMLQSAGISGESGLPGPRERRMTMAYEELFQSPMVSLPIY